MKTITLRYDFGQEDQDSFEYEVEVNYAYYLKPYLEEKYVDVEDAVEDLDKNGVFDADEKEKALQCKSLNDLADYIIDNDEDQAESIVESDEDFVENYIEEELKEENEDDAYDEYKDANDGCDPDGFYGWDDYWHWKNG